MSDPVQKNVVSIEAYEQMRRSPMDGPGAQSLREAGRLTTDRLNTLLERMMDRVDDALFERAEKAENNMLQTRYFDAMRELRLIRRDISEHFITLFTTWFNEGIPRDKETGGLELDWENDSPAMGLVDSDDLEEQLAITSMVNKIRDNADQIVRFDDVGTDDADVVAVSYGITSRVTREGIDMIPLVEGGDVVELVEDRGLLVVGLVVPRACCDHAPGPGAAGWSARPAAGRGSPP